MSVSNLFGRTLGEKKIELIMNKYSDILISKENEQEKTQKIQNIKGIAEKTATIFVENIETFNNFIKECKSSNIFFLYRDLLYIIHFPFFPFFPFSAFKKLFSKNPDFYTSFEKTGKKGKRENGIINIFV